MIRFPQSRQALVMTALLFALSGAGIAYVAVPRIIGNRLDKSAVQGNARDMERAILEQMVVVLDAGHGGIDSGTKGHGLQEKTGTIDLTQRLAEKLRRAGVQVLLTRSKDEYIALEKRCALAAEAGAAVFVSIHLNASSARGVSGIETYYCSSRKGDDLSGLRKKLAVRDEVVMEDHRAEDLASAIQRRVCQAAGAADRGVRDSKLFVTRHTACPAVLVECGYLTNANEAQRLKRASYKDKLVAGIAEGIRHHLLVRAVNPKRGLVFPKEMPGPLNAATIASVGGKK